MSVLNGINTTEEIKETGDSLGTSFTPVESGAYPATIKLAYFTVSKAKAVALTLEFETENKSIIRQSLWISSKEAKGCKNYYVNKQGDKMYLPGFNQANAICLLTVGKPLLTMTDEEKVISLYDPAVKAEVPTKVDMVTDLLGKQVTLGVIKQIVNINRPDDKGVYKATNELRTENEIDKIFRYKDGLTVTEIKAEVKEAVFIDQWKDKNNGKTRDRSVKVKDGGVKQGSPAATGATSGDDLFA
jgi:hypothetical protein